MLHLLRAELYRHPRRMTVLVSFAALLFLAITNMFGWFSYLRLMQVQTFERIGEPGEMTMFTYLAEQDGWWHSRFSELYNNQTHIMVFTALMVTLPLAFDLAARRNDELTAAGYSSVEIYVTKTLAAIPVALACYLFLLTVNFFLPFQLVRGCISPKEGLVMLEIVGVSVARFVAYAFAGAALPFLLQKPLYSFLACVGMKFVLSPKLLFSRFFKFRLQYLQFDTIDTKSFFGLFKAIEDPAYNRECGTYLLITTLALLAIGLLIWGIGMAANAIWEKRR